MQVTCLRMVERIRAPRCWSVVTRGRIGEGAEGEGAGVNQGGREPPWLVRGPGGGILIVESFMAKAVGPKQRGSVKETRQS